jgi:hypothetical protein
MWCCCQRQHLLHAARHKMAHDAVLSTPSITCRSRGCCCRCLTWTLLPAAGRRAHDEHLMQPARSQPTVPHCRTLLPLQVPNLDAASSTKTSVKQRGIPKSLRMLAAGLVDLLRTAVGRGPLYLPCLSVLTCHTWLLLQVPKPCCCCQQQDVHPAAHTRSAPDEIFSLHGDQHHCSPAARVVAAAGA